MCLSQINNTARRTIGTKATMTRIIGILAFTDGTQRDVHEEKGCQAREARHRFRLTTEMRQARGKAASRSSRFSTRKYMGYFGDNRAKLGRVRRTQRVRRRDRGGGGLIGRSADREQREQGGNNSGNTF